MEGNPFSLNFGVEPASYIARTQQTEEVSRNFLADPSPAHVYLFTGVRGSGKTVLLAEMEDRFRQEGWVVCDLSIESDLLESFAAKLYNVDKFRALFSQARINLSHFGFGVELHGVPPVTDIGTAIEQMMAVLQRQKKKVLIAIDEAVGSASMRRFVSEFQILLRAKYPVYLLMTGLYENIYGLQNEKTMTFLYRAPKIALSPLSLPDMTGQYRRIFHTSFEHARDMAYMTRGYSYAYQVLGYLCWERQTDRLTEDVMDEFDLYMFEYAYAKIWEEQSPTKRKILSAMAASGERQVTAIREAVGLSPQAFSVYRSRLIRQGVLEADGYGRIEFALPRFDAFVREQDSLML